MNLALGSLVALVIAAAPVRAGTFDGSTDVLLTPPEAAYLVTTDITKWSSLTLGSLHLLDHGLRNNHSGWPFNSKLTPTTFFLFAVPAVWGVGYKLDGPLYWTIASSALLTGLAFAHLSEEHPSHQYRPWVNGTNLLETESKPLGALSVGVSLALAASLTVQVASNILDGRRNGFTWTRRKGSERASVAFMPSRTGGLVGAGWSF